MPQVRRVARSASRSPMASRSPSPSRSRCRSPAGTSIPRSAWRSGSRARSIRRGSVGTCSQLLGAIVAALLIKLLFPASLVRIMSVGTPQISGSVSLFGAIVLEALFTFFLVSAVFGTIVMPRTPQFGGFAVGLSVLVCVFVGGGLTGAVMNPARAFGPALVSMDWHGQVVYWIGPGLGAAGAAA